MTQTLAAVLTQHPYMAILLYTHKYNSPLLLLFVSLCGGYTFMWILCVCVCVCIQVYIHMEARGQP